jgi:TetR/AcrR family transcriptional repressor of nem operon
MTQIVDAFEAAASQPGGQTGIKSIVENYLSVTHRDNRADGCPLAGMGSELVRGDESVRSIASGGFARLVDVMAAKIHREEPETARSTAVFALAAMIGAVTLSRIVSDPDISSSVLRNVSEHLGGI